MKTRIERDHSPSGRLRTPCDFDKTARRPRRRNRPPQRRQPSDGWPIAQAPRRLGVGQVPRCRRVSRPALRATGGAGFREETIHENRQTLVRIPPAARSEMDALQDANPLADAGQGSSVLVGQSRVFVRPRVPLSAAGGKDQSRIHRLFATRLSKAIGKPASLPSVLKYLPWRFSTATRPTSDCGPAALLPKDSYPVAEGYTSARSLIPMPENGPPIAILELTTRLVAAKSQAARESVGKETWKVSDDSMNGPDQTTTWSIRCGYV